MAVDEPADELGEASLPLYDFLYRDPQRLASYYAQMFKGRIVQIEATRSTRDNKTSTFKTTAGVVGGDLQSIRETQELLKEVSDLHDIATVDVLVRLMEQMVDSSVNIEDAVVGQMVKIKGRIVFLDKTMLEFATVGLSAALEQMKLMPKQQRDQTGIKNFEMLIRMLPKMPMPSSFLINTAEGINISGTIKDEGMDEPLAGHYFKHGTEGLPDVQIIGIKEGNPGDADPLASTPFLTGVTQAFRGSAGYDDSSHCSHCHAGRHLPRSGSCTTDSIAS